MTTRALAGVALLAAATGAAASDGAAAPTLDGLQEVTVTARRRAESILEVPISVTAWSAQEIERQNARDFNDVSRYTPGFFFADQVAGRKDRSFRRFVIRGLNLNSFTSVSDPVLLFVDGAPVVSGELPSFADVESLEVLRGPQSVQFGRNAFAGAINVRTRTPAPEWSGDVGLEYARFGSTDAQASVEGPLIGGSAFRIGVRQTDLGGQYVNSADGRRELGARNTRQASLTLAGGQATALRWKVFGSVYTFDDGPSATALILSPEMTCPAGATGARPNWICGTVPRADRIVVGSDDTFDAQFRSTVLPLSIFAHPLIEGPGLNKRNGDAHGILDWQWPSGITLSAIAAWHSEKSEALVDTDGRATTSLPNPNYGAIPGVRPFVNWLVLVDRKFQDASAEIRLNSPDAQHALRWTFGLNYVDVRSIQSAVFGDTPYGALVLDQSGEANAKTPSTFGGVYATRGAFTLGLEGRYQQDQLERISAAGKRLTQKYNSFSPRVSLTYEYSEQLRPYVQWAKSYRPGTFNVALLDEAPSVVSEIARLTGAGLVVDEESLSMYELGVKWSDAQRSTLVSANVYRGTLTNQQQSQGARVTRPNGIPASFLVVTNGGETRISGFEFEGSWQPTPAWGVDGSLSLANTRITSGICTICGGLSGNADVAGKRLPNYPRLQAALSLVHKRAAFAGAEFFSSLDISYRSSMYATAANLAETGGRTVVDARAGLSRRRVRVEVFVTNALNDHGALQIGRTTDPVNGGSALAVSLPDPRSVGVRARYSF